MPYLPVGTCYFSRTLIWNSNRIKMDTISILFVCLGNICRSPAAETIFKSIVEKEGVEDKIEADSAGLISCHEGESADSRMRNMAYQHGYLITHKSRPIQKSDFYKFDLIIGMDNENVRKLHQLCPPDAKAEIHLMTEYCTQHTDEVVPDPYYGGTAGFTHVIDLLEDSCIGLFKHIINK